MLLQVLGDETFDETFFLLYEYAICPACGSKTENVEITFCKELQYILNERAHIQFKIIFFFFQV